MSLYGTFIPAASTSLIHVPSIQRVLKHCGMHKHMFTRDSKQSILNTLAGGQSPPAGV